MFLIGMFVFSFSYLICKYVHSALQQVTVNSKRTRRSIIGCGQRDPTLGHIFSFMMDAWFAKQYWLHEPTSWLTSSHSSVSSLSSWFSFAFCLHLCFFRRGVAMALKKNASFFIPEKWRRQRSGGFRTFIKCWKPWKLRTSKQTF